MMTTNHRKVLEGIVHFIGVCGILELLADIFEDRTKVYGQGELTIRTRNEARELREMAARIRQP